MAGHTGELSPSSRPCDGNDRGVGGGDDDGGATSSRRRGHTVSVASASVYRKQLKPTSSSTPKIPSLGAALNLGGSTGGGQKSSSNPFSIFTKRVHRSQSSVVPPAATLAASAAGESDDAGKSWTAPEASSKTSGLDPRFVFLQLYHSPVFQHHCRLGDSSSSTAPILIPEGHERAIAMIDAIYPYDTHDFGVLYVAPGQMAAPSPETAILSNTCGSPRYADFLGGLGRLVPLKNRPVDARLDDLYLDGLDTTRDARDGKYTYHWKDELTQVCFHVATLMPNRDDDARFVNKKRHIGNDAVHIVYNDSGQEYRNGIIKSQFNYASVVVKPIEHGDNVVRVQSKEEVADIIGHEEPQIVSDANLPLFVRQFAIHAHVAARYACSFDLYWGVRNCPL